MLPENLSQITKEEQQFEDDLNTLVTSGESAKKAFQNAVRFATKRAIYNKDMEPTNRLFNKLNLIESDYYKKKMRANYAAWCGDCVPTTKGKYRIYYRTKKPAIYYTEEIGKKGWHISADSARLKLMQKTYKEETKYTRFTEIEFSTIQKKADKKLIELAKKLYDKAIEIRDTEDVWNSIDSKWVEVFRYLSNIPEIKD